jgi:predicted membrane protein (TIGR00267 family)
VTTAPQEEENYRLEGIAFGLADGLIMCLGLIIGVAEATLNAQLVLITGIIGGFANAFGNSIGFYMAQSAERALQLRASTDHGVATRVHPKREVLINSLFSFASTIAVVLVLLLPFTCLSLNHATALTFVIGPAIAFVLGSYVGKIGRDNPYTTGLKYVILAVLGAVISHFIADLIQLVA